MEISEIDFPFKLFTSFLNGYLLGLSLIIAPGVQNLFVIKQRINKNHPILAAFTCSIADSVLILCSIAGISAVISSNEVFKKILAVISIAFLVLYCYKSIRLVICPEGKENQDKVEKNIGNSRVKTILLSISLSWLNPQAIIDTVLIIGGASASYNVLGSWIFGFGAAISSFSWFFLLSHSAQAFSKIINTHKVERLLNLTIIIIMIYIIIHLMRSLLN
jgi:L-lysine exporter family protein LysE/ArgO